MEKFQGWIKIHCVNCDKYSLVDANGLCEDCNKKLTEKEKKEFRKYRYVG
jgi:hypothetical protein